MERPLALVVVQDSIVRATVRDALDKQHLVQLAAHNGSEAMELLQTRPVDLIICDVEAPGLDAHELLLRASRAQPPRLVLALAPSGDGALDMWLRAGAFEALQKPLDRTQLHQAVYRATRQRELLAELRQLREDLQSREGYHGLVGRSASMDRLRQQIQRLSTSASPVCFLGEVGTGKEYAARTLHARSGEGAGPFVSIPCAGLESILEGSSSVLDQARGGTLFLEELSALPPQFQESLSRGLLPAAMAANVRILSSSVRDPRKAVADGLLLEDVRRALAGETLLLPPLRERVDDIPLLAAHFLRTICEINHVPPIQLSREALQLLQRYRWPENVQELRQAMEHVSILARDGLIRPEDLPERIRAATMNELVPVKSKGAAVRRFREAKRDVVEAFERSYLQELMLAHAGNVTAASQHAGMLRSALQRLLRKYGMRSAEFRRMKGRLASAEEAHADG